MNDQKITALEGMVRSEEKTGWLMKIKKGDGMLKSLAVLTTVLLVIGIACSEPLPGLKGSWVPFATIPGIQVGQPDKLTAYYNKSPESLDIYIFTNTGSVFIRVIKVMVWIDDPTHDGGGFLNFWTLKGIGNSWTLSTTREGITKPVLKGGLGHVLLKTLSQTHPEIKFTDSYDNLQRK
jgi:hypothetical protein